MSRWSTSGGWYPPSLPRRAEGGLKTRRTRGHIGTTWWSERFVRMLEDIGLGSRLQRGRTYARQGQVLSLDVGAGVVSALVQGSRAKPYRVRIGIAALDKRQWAEIERSLAGDAWYAAKLLAGEMPDDIEDVFAAHGVTLFPTAAVQLSLDCSCPDWEVPCKHLAAVFYVLAESFDDDPFAILAWRGRARDDLLANLHAARSAGRPAADREERAGAPLAACLDRYFAIQTALPVGTPPVTSSTALLDQLPAVDIAVRGRNLVELLRPAYASLGAMPNTECAGSRSGSELSR